MPILVAAVSSLVRFAVVLTTGGSGKQSLVRLSAYMSNYALVQTSKKASTADFVVREQHRSCGREDRQRVGWLLHACMHACQGIAILTVFAIHVYSLPLLSRCYVRIR